MMKQLNKLRGKIALMGLFALVALVLGSCANPLITPRTDQAAGGDASVLIRFSAGDARTIIPTAGFAKYVVEFSATGGSNHADETVTGADALAGTKEITLDPDDWTITIKGYVNVGDAPTDHSAIGTATVTLGAGEHAVVPITLSPETGGANGTFTYSIAYPSGAYGGYIFMYDAWGASVFDYYPTSSQSNVSEILAPGYYRLIVGIYGPENSIIQRSEIVHIYPGLTTEVNYPFTADDFGSFITIAGVVDLDGLDVSSGYLNFYPDSDYNWWASVTYANVNPVTGAWSTTIAAYNSPTPLYLKLDLDLNGGGTVTKRIPAPITVYNADLTVPLGPFPVSQYTIGGRIDLSGIIPHVAANTYDYGYGNIVVYADDGTGNQLAYVGIENNGGVLSWQAQITGEAALPVIIQCSVLVNTNGDSISEQKKVTLSGNTSGLNFAPSVVPQGTAAVRETDVYSNDTFLFVPASSGEYILRASVSGGGVHLNLYDLANNNLGNTYGSPFTEITQTLTAGTAYLVWVQPDTVSSYQFLATPSTAVTVSGTVTLTGLTGAGITVTSGEVSINGGPAASINTSTGAWSRSISAITGTTALVEWSLQLNGGNGGNTYLNGSILVPITGATVTVPAITPVVVSGDTVTQALQTGQNGYSSFIYKPASTEVFRMEVTSAGAFDIQIESITDVGNGNRNYPNSPSAAASLDGGTPYMVLVKTEPANTGYTFTANAVPITWVESSFDAGNQSREFAYTIPAGGSIIVYIVDSDNYGEFGKSPVNSQDVRYQISWTGGADIVSLVDNSGRPPDVITNTSGAPRGITVRVVPYNGPGSGTGTFYVGTIN